MFRTACREDTYIFTRLGNAGIAILSTTIIIYGIVGSPTPDQPGLPEFLIGFLLCLAFVSFSLCPLCGKDEPWQNRAWNLLVYGLSVPVVFSFIAGAGLVPVLRDVFAFLFLLLPFFMRSRARDASSRLLLTGAVTAAGLLFALRAAARPLIAWLMGQRPIMHDPLYLANAPTVLFAALLLLGLAGRELYAGATLTRLLRAAFLAMLTIIPVAAMVLAMQRASLAAIVFYVGALSIAAAVYRPRQAAFLLTVILFAGIANGNLSLNIYHLMAHKMEMVGANMRWQEAAAVFDRLGANPFAVLFGEGWGSQIASPAVGGETVNFTHSLVTSYWLKTGLCGLILVLIYLYELGRIMVREMRKYPILCAAITLPLLIDIFLYASFKSLDFGLILLLIPLWTPEVASERQKI